MARPERLIVWSREPLNAETPLRLLCRSHVTPTDAFFVRNHGSVPAVDAEAYRLTLRGDVREPVALSLSELRERFPRATVAATLACAGSRRRELARVAPVSGIPWGAGAIGNAIWTGARLSDVLLAAGIEPGARHVAFTGLDDAEPEAFGGSIPLAKALGREVLLAYEMNCAPLPAEHGFPLRAVVPGYIGARSVKWLSAISVQRAPSAAFFQRRDYMLGGRSLADLPLSSAVCLPRDGAAIRGRKISVEGYAIGGGGRSPELLEVSSDGGKTWLAAGLGGGDRWTWRLWHADLDVAPGCHELVVRAWDGSPDGQPQDLSTTWNRSGYMNNAWHRVRLTTTRREPVLRARSRQESLRSRPVAERRVDTAQRG